MPLSVTSKRAGEIRTMQSPPGDRAASASALRYNLFRAKWHPDLCCAVPEDQPVPGFITGESWDFGGTWGGVLPRPGTAAVAELDVCLNGCHLLRIAGPSRGIDLAEYDAGGGPRQGGARQRARMAARLRTHRRSRGLIALGREENDAASRYVPSIGVLLFEQGQNVLCSCAGLA